MRLGFNWVLTNRNHHHHHHHDASAYDPPKQGGYTNKQTNKQRKLVNYRTSGKTFREKINPSVTIACQWGQLELKLALIIHHSIMSRLWYLVHQVAV